MLKTELYQITGFISYTNTEKPPTAHFISDTFVEILRDNETDTLEKFSLIYHGERYDRDYIVLYYTKGSNIEEFVAKETQKLLEYDLIVRFGTGIHIARGDKETVVKATKTKK